MRNNKKIKTGTHPSLMLMPPSLILEYIPVINSTAWVTLSDLKKIHAKVTIAKVKMIFSTSVQEGSHLFPATISICFLFESEISKGRNIMALINPQQIKVQLAPCQKPLIRKMIKVFLILLSNDP
jgi:hypothetical protein